MTSDTGQSREAYANWSAPQEDGGVLVWPEPARLIEAARENRARLDAAAHVRIGGWSLPELRRLLRPLLGERDRLIFATGHQSELQHPGVWIKNAVICAAANASGGAALHISVDTDAPKHLKLRWPGFAEPVTDDPRLNSAAWTGQLKTPSPQHLERLLKATDEGQRAGLISELLGQFLEHCRGYVSTRNPSAAPSLAEMLAGAQHTLDRELGLHYARIRLSELLVSTAWSQFVCALAKDARRFAEAYNAALADYRRAAGIDSLDRPAPNLLMTRSRVELPFWLDDLALGQRRRAEISLAGDRATLAVPDPGSRTGIASTPHEPFDFNAASDPAALVHWLSDNNLRLSPRALSLTLFVRMCLCDLFVHGIGGGLYDQVTDRIIRDYFRVEPPAFAVASATLFHPRAVGRARIDLTRLRHEEHNLAHEALGGSKRQWLERIGEAGDPRNRRAIFEAMHEARRAALLTDIAYGDFQRRLAEARQQAANESEIFDRELFYAIQPKERLSALLENVRSAFGCGA